MSLLAVAALAKIALLVGGTPADAQPFWSNSAFDSRPAPAARAVPQPRPRSRGNRAVSSPTSARASKRAPASQRKDDAAGNRASGPARGEMLAIVNLAGQRITIYDSSGEIMQSRVSTGKSGHRTPQGIFSILQKRRYHESNLYSNAPMPFMQRLTWSGIALHAGVVPGYPASHGCIRLPTGFASQLFKSSRMGMRVVVAPQNARAMPIDHPALPKPIMLAAPADVSEHGLDDRRSGVEAPIRVAAADQPTTDGPRPEAAAANAVATAAVGTAPVATRFFNPMERAQAERAKAKAAAQLAEQAASSALDEARDIAARADQARDRLEALKEAVADAEDRLAKAKAAELAGAPGGAAALAEKRMAALIHLADMRRALKETEGLEEVLRPASFDAAVASRSAEDALAKAKQQAAEAATAVNAAAVLISRRTGRLYIRQGFAPVFDAPVAFKSPDQPIGTHLYMAMQADSTSGQVRWMAVTVPESARRGDQERRPVKRGHPAVDDDRPPSSATAALDRLIVAPEVMREVASRLWQGGSIVITDHGISNETGKYTDFVVLTR